MNQSIVWKIVLTAIALFYALTSLIPVEDTPFPEYIRAEASATAGDDAEFGTVLEEAQALMEQDPDEYPSLYVALSRMSEEQGLDLAPYFPELNVSDIKNRKKRNEILLAELLKRSRGKVHLGLDLAGGVSVTYAIAEESLADDARQRQEDLQKARTIISERVNGLGVTEPVIRLRGENAIEVQMPGVSAKDNPQILDTIGKPALLEFSLVHPRITPQQQPNPPVGYKRMLMETEDPETGRIVETPLYVKRIPEMKGDRVDEAVATTNQYGSFLISLELTGEGQEEFARITEANVGNRLAIILDGKLYSAPNINEPITGGRAQISGQFDQREAIDLANVLNNPLEVGLEVEEMYEVGPSLAAGARDASLLAGAIGGGLVILFMLAYYGIAGVAAILSVLVNVLLVLGILASFGATITLPGVAALVLTIGMAVDANILILERMREELANGKSLHNALLAGFDKALSTIVDANVTTFITALILFWLGSGPVKGFGLTLMIGIGATLFCSLIVFRWVFELFVNSGILKKLSARQFFSKSEFQFLNYAGRAFAFGWTLVAIGVIATIFHWHNIFGIDFVGGDEVSISFQEQIPAADIHDFAESEGFGEVTALYQSLIGSDMELLKVQTERGQGDDFFTQLSTAFPEAGLERVGLTEIGAAVGENVTNSAILSIAISLLGILLYIAVRFEFGYGLGAITATVHDVLMTVGIYVTLGEFLGIGSGQFTAPMIAAILMTVGYSINDTIVVFDRVREELDLNPGMHLKKVVHLAINRVLNRTILTSVTTLLATFSLYIFGAGVIIDFALVFMIGILTGTFSSVFIASPVFFWYHKGDRRKVEAGHILPSYDWTTDESSRKATEEPAK